MYYNVKRALSQFILGRENMPKRKCSNVNQSFGKNLVKYRKLCGFTQQEIADILNLNRTTYTKYETGVSEPSFEILKKIVAVYGVDVNAILGQEEFEKNLHDFVMPMYNLTNEERELVGIYRMLSKEEKQELMDKAREIKTIKNNTF